MRGRVERDDDKILQMRNSKKKLKINKFNLKKKNCHYKYERNLGMFRVGSIGCECVCVSVSGGGVFK